MLYDRHYMKSPRLRFNKSLCDVLIFSLLITFVVQCLATLLGYNIPLENFFSLNMNSLSLNGFIWILITYGFLHDGPIHLLFNLLGIHFIGRNVENLLSPRDFKYLCVGSLILGGTFWLTFNQSNANLIGFSACVLALLTFFCLNYPDKPISLLLFFVLPVRLKPKFILLGTLGIELYGFLFSELRGSTSIAHSAHLGGVLAGIISFLIINNKVSLPLKFKLKFQKRKLNPTVANQSTNYSVNFTDQDMQRKVDTILDKINAHGFGSLTKQEKRCLEQAKEILGRE